MTNIFRVLLDSSSISIRINGATLIFLPNFPGATFIQRATITPDFRVTQTCVFVKYTHKNFRILKMKALFENEPHF